MPFGSCRQAEGGAASDEPLGVSTPDLVWGSAGPGAREIAAARIRAKQNCLVFSADLGWEGEGGEAGENGYVFLTKCLYF